LVDLNSKDFDSIALIGFGEAGQAFVEGWHKAGYAGEIFAFDIKTLSKSQSIVDAKMADYEKFNVTGCKSAKEAVAVGAAVFSLVTADKAFEAASEAAKFVRKSTFFFDCNSCAPGSKRKSAALIEAAGGRYVDTAVMAPVHPKLHQTPLLIAGPHSIDAVSYLNNILAMSSTRVEGDVGAASSIKMIRSVIMKGLEAVILESVLAGRRAGVDDIVLDSMEQTYPGFGWKKRAAYMMERAATHGIRRSAEMREVANTVRELGFSGSMSDAAADWEQMIGELRLDMSLVDNEDHGAVAETLLAPLNKQMKHTG
jgi:3-hydroxyisobutyrate dehydrogenase-like beta-hydroxyacid dehydrogenase